jgi:hypothetical protein
MNIIDIGLNWLRRILRPARKSARRSYGFEKINHENWGGDRLEEAS